MEDGLHHATLPEIWVNRLNDWISITCLYKINIRACLSQFGAAVCERAYHNIRQNSDKRRQELTVELSNMPMMNLLMSEISTWIPIEIAMKGGL